MRLTHLLVAACVLLGGGCATADRPLQLLSGAAPVYPANAKAAGVEGYVVVEYGVSAAGQVVSPRVVESQPPGIFDEAALTAVRQWRFQAPLQAGQAQAVPALRSTLNFRLSGGERYAEFEPQGVCSGSGCGPH